jgi:hypothetical protein
MAKQWSIELSERNAELMLVGDINNPAHSGVGLYKFDIPPDLYGHYRFNFAAMLDAPRGITCKIYYHSQVYSPHQSRSTDLSKSGGHTMLVGYESVFMPGVPVRSTDAFLTLLSFSEWKACLMIEFLSDGVMCDPGKWKLNLDFTFESVDALRENARQVIQKQLDDAEINRLKSQMRLEAEAKKAMNPEFTYDKLLRLKKEELQAICRKHKLPTSGIKCDIIKRLMDSA